MMVHCLPEHRVGGEMSYELDVFCRYCAGDLRIYDRYNSELDWSLGMFLPWLSAQSCAMTLNGTVESGFAMVGTSLHMLFFRILVEISK